MVETITCFSVYRNASPAFRFFYSAWMVVVTRIIKSCSVPDRARRNPVNKVIIKFGVGIRRSGSVYNHKNVDAEKLRRHSSELVHVCYGYGFGMSFNENGP